MRPSSSGRAGVYRREQPNGFIEDADYTPSRLKSRNRHILRTPLHMLGLACLRKTKINPGVSGYLIDLCNGTHGSTTLGNDLLDMIKQFFLDIRVKGQQTQSE